MNNLNMFCLTINPKHENLIKKIGYTPVGLGNKKFSNYCLSDKTGDNISSKNEFYGEYTFHYWLWKNYVNKLDDNWIGFCQYRKFWTIREQFENISLENLSDNLLKKIPDEFQDYDVILGKPFFVNERKTMKFIKNGFPLIMANPKILFKRDLRTINFHFDLMHGRGNLHKAIDVLDEKNKTDFKNFVNTEVSFNPHNMFICKSKKILLKYYQDIFPWLKSCEKIFGFDNLEGYGLKRIYGFLAERYLSYWFKKNTKYLEIPILFFDINNHLE